ncbi:MAG: hypothetical protein ACOX4D_06390 [Bacteroidales bacterium]|jgi:hypothetical protein
MTISEIVELINGTFVVTCEKNLNLEINKAFASDLMSDVLTIDENNLLLITGLANTQTIRTADMAEIKNVVIGRCKVITPDMIELAKNLEINLVSSPYSLYHISGILFKEGIEPIF